MLDYLSLGLLSQLLINGVLFGTMYGIAAIGLSLIFGTMQIIFVAQGTMIILAAFFCFWLFTLLSIDPYLSLLIIIPAFLLFGRGFYEIVFRKVAGSKITSLLIAFGLMALLEHLMTVLWTANTRAIQTSYTTYSISAIGSKISFTRLISFFIALLSALGVTVFLKKTLIGKAVRAASENLVSCRLIGISPQRVNGITFAIGIGLAAIAGVATATTYPFDPYSGFIFSLKAMVALALGGLGSVWGAFLGGVLLGVLESWGSFFISGGWADAISYGVFLGILMFKPEGLFTRSSDKAGESVASLASDVTSPQIMTGYLDLSPKVRKALPLLIVLGLCVVPFIVDTEKSYLIYFLFLAFIYIALSQAWNLIAGYTGQVSLGHHAFFAVGAYVTGMIWIHKLTGTGYYFDPVTMFLSGLGSAIFAVIIGIPLLSKLRGDYFALGTLGLGEILRVLFIKGKHFTGGAVGLILPSGVYKSMVPYYFTSLFLALFATGITYAIVRSRIGLALKAINQDEIAAAANGIHILKYKVLALAVGAFLAGLCGSLQGYYLFHIHPEGFLNLNWTLYPILMCVLGGIGTIVGPIIGAMFLTGVFSLANIYLPAIHPIFSGALIIIVMLFLPNGVIRLKMPKKQIG
jgi:ABC-type branched-subunit amino acid transport system permease subunit